MAKGPPQEYGPWGLYLLAELPDNGYPDCGDAISLYFSLYQSDGLIADTSSGSKEHRVDSVIFQS